MDYTILVLLIVATLIIAPTAVNIMYKIADTKSKKKDQKKKRIKEIKKFKRNKKYANKVIEQKKMARTIKSLRTKDNIIAFYGRGSNTYDVKVNTITDFDPSKEIIIRGHLYYMQSNGRYREVPIYLFQPRYQTEDGKKVGPFLTQRGHLQERNPYIAKAPDTGEILRGYLPKREIISGMNFDFIAGSPNFEEPKLAQFLRIDAERDENGNYIPLDLNDPDQALGFRRYLAFHQTKEKAIEYFSNIYSTALHSSKQYGFREAKTPSKIMRVEQENVDDFYNKFRYPRKQEQTNQREQNMAEPEETHKRRR